MTVTEAFETARYVVDADGTKTDVLLPLPIWEKLIAAWIRLIEALEDQEDRVILQDWIAKRAKGEVETVSLDDLTREMIADGLTPG